MTISREEFQRRVAASVHARRSATPKKASADKKPDKPKPEPPLVLTRQQFAATTDVIKAHRQAFRDCSEAAVITEDCGHRGMRTLCWGCRQTVAAFGLADDPCLEDGDFRVRCADPAAGTLLCAAVLAPPVAQQAAL